MGSYWVLYMFEMPFDIFKYKLSGKWLNIRKQLKGKIKLAVKNVKLRIIILQIVIDCICIADTN